MTAASPERAGSVAPFGLRLREAVRSRGPLCVGVDPHRGLLDSWGLGDDVEGLRRFCERVVAAFAGEVAVIKPQVAFFERHGSRGVAVLEELNAQLRAGGALVLNDAKRGDIGSTMQAYADAWVGASSALAGDAVTVSPFLGFGSLRPVIDTAAATGRGVFVLALTSNPEGREVQHARAADGRSVAGALLDDIRAENAPAVAAGAGLGNVGAVIGATIGAAGRALTPHLRVGGPLLAPGMGAQGATAGDLATVFGDALPDVLPSASREVLGAGPGIDRLRQAALRLRDDLAEKLR